MSRIVSVHIDGLAELERNLEQLPREVERKVIRTDLLDAAALVRDAFVAEAPKDTGFLAEHFKTKASVSTHDVSGTVVIGPSTEDYPDRDGSYRRKMNAKTGKYKNVGRIGVADVARYNEFGTVKQHANAFMSRAYESTKSAVLNKIIDGIRAALGKVTR